MKFKMIICALIGAGISSMALAQSSASLYGTLDVGYEIGNDGIYESNDGQDSKFHQWGYLRSTIGCCGLKGGDDLGSGLSIYFNLESEIDSKNEGVVKKSFF